MKFERKDRRGGRREGAGRPRGEFQEKVVMYVTTEQRRKIKALGGSKWFRELLDKQREQQPEWQEQDLFVLNKKNSITNL